MKKFIIPIGVFALLIFYVIATYNSIVGKEENVKQNWSEVQNTYQRRMDLIPNLVSVVKGVSEFEKSVMQRVAELRSRASQGLDDKTVSAENYDRQRQLQDSLAANVNRLIVIIEAYPELQGTKAYLALQKQLAGTERRIAVARKDFNESVFEYNKKVKSFPSSIVASVTGFKPRLGFDSVAGAEQPVEIKFNQ